MVYKASRKPRGVPKALLLACLRNASVECFTSQRMPELDALVSKYKLDPAAPVSCFNLLELPSELVHLIGISLANSWINPAESLVRLGATCKVMDAMPCVVLYMRRCTNNAGHLGHRAS